MSDDFPQRFAFLNFKKVLVEVCVALVVEAQVGESVLAQQQLFSRSDLVEELGQDFVVSERLRDLVALHWLVGVATESQNFLDSRIIGF